jgi:hypothetical protein
MAARLSVEPMALLAGSPDRFAFETGAAVEAHLALGRRSAGGAHDPALLLRGQLVRTSIAFDGGAAATEASFNAGIELR